MAAKILPFLKKPRKQYLVEVGNEDIGTIEVPRYDDLTPNEIEYIKQNLKDIPSVQDSLTVLVQKIASTTGRKMTDIYNSIVNVNILEFADDNLADLFEFQKLQREVAYREKVVLASAILLHRIPTCRDWSQEDVGDPNVVHPKLLRELADFARKERDGWGTEKTEEPSEEELKKISPVLDNEPA